MIPAVMATTVAGRGIATKAPDVLKLVMAVPIVFVLVTMSCMQSCNVHAWEACPKHWHCSARNVAASAEMMRLKDQVESLSQAPCEFVNA
mmetsp:Transcript_36617/g.67113  ORF Transcript_36617/g.67113 Transcript_36617/m.67113 type:complete len:90 (+) Transcript_36617:276-545(+)